MEILSDAEIESLEHETIYLKSVIQKCLNTIKLQRQQLAQREAELAAYRDSLLKVHTYVVFSEIVVEYQKLVICKNAEDILDRTQATAEAHNVKVREEAIREYSAYLAKCTGMEMIIESAEYSILGKVLIDN